MANSGGSYTRKKGSKKVVLKECTKEHENGNRPRNKKGEELRKNPESVPEESQVSETAKTNQE